MTRGGHASASASQDHPSHLHAQPYGQGYRTRTTTEFGRPIELPQPFGFALDTTGFKIYPPRRPTR
ncbi:hypothetical protein [Streptomyces xiamenensis]|uniref:hypothetical protein n=1 Tax=Streptomyces xiamenensis TaxID=408015 RepID=UPI000A910ED4|nr:hypothetical protein [Streptomyces xiamenensis]